MDDSDEYGELDDTAFLEAATQVEGTAAPAFQQSPRATKRRKTGHRDERSAIPPPVRRRQQRRRSSVESDDDDALESCRSHKSASPAKQAKRARTAAAEHGDPAEEEAQECSKYLQKKRVRIHTPTTALDMTDMFYTQPPQEHSPPWKPRGAIWQKPGASIGVHRPSEPPQAAKFTGLDAMRTMGLAGRNSISSRPASRPLQEPTASIEIIEPTSFSVADGAVDFDPVDELADLPSDAFESSSSSPQKQDSDVAFVSERRTRLVAPQTGLRQTTLFGRQGLPELPPSQLNKRYNFVASQKAEPATHHKLDPEAMKTWVYPINLGTVRDYQFNIVARGLYHNLLVALPTGLGKTFIAATVMLNWFRWTTEAQIVFVAPTKPLVAQQVEACFNIAGIPRSYTTMLTGSVPTGVRAEEWKSKRVFFMTPQTLSNDLKTGIADPKKIVLLVVDEAHKATGSYAYVEVVSFLRRFNPSYRVLALTATPGSDVEAVQKVIDGLDISRIEIRTETSLDISKYVHHRTVEKQTFRNSEEMEMCMELYTNALQSCVNTLNRLNAFWSKNPCDLTPYGCNQASRKWSADTGKNATKGEKFQVFTIFSILGSLSQGMELLKYHGIAPFYMKMKEFQDGQAGSKSKYKKEICEHESFKKLMVRLRSWVTSDNFVGHPKLEYLQEVVLDHFVNAAEGQNVDAAPPSQTRIMVFAHFRDSAEEIARVLKRHEPMIRPRVFVGQSSAKNSEGMTQKEQLEVIQDFKKGTYNTLIATSIGEEGLDIGEVDLIVCYDSKASPIRMLQRMGRTGRKRQGKIILLQMEGKEVNDAEKAKDSYEKMQELIAEGSKFTFHDGVSRRILPRDVQPIVDRCVVEIPLENSQSDFLPEPRKKGRVSKKPPKKFHMPDGVITGFVKAGRMDEEIALKPRGKKKAVKLRPSEELYQVPPLETVLLDEAATRDLEKRFQTVFDEDEPPTVTLKLGRDTDRQRILSRTQHFHQPGDVTRRFVETFQRMHEVDDERIEKFRRSVHYSDCESEPEDIIVVAAGTMGVEVVDEDMWASDDPASQPLPQPRATNKPKPRPKTKAGPKAQTGTTPKRKTVPKTPKEKMASKLPKEKSTPKTPAARGRPRKSAVASTTPERTKTPTFRVSDLVDKGAESSPPPTDPRMRLASQAVDLGSDDTEGEEDLENTQAYLLDSDLRDFIAGDEEDLDVPDSSLPSLGLGGFGKGTQAVLQSAYRRPRKAEKLFTSDPTDDDAIVSSDSDDEELVRQDVGKRPTYVADSSEDEDDEPLIQPQKRVRRVIEDDDD
ncbi:P-loop containing nucleoside triphosphate hydrolase protein, partial [Lophiostoma macrostomum CBS 122681]